jgi:hypothetical protein
MDFYEGDEIVWLLAMVFCRELSKRTGAGWSLDLWYQSGSLRSRLS